MDNKKRLHPKAFWLFFFKSIAKVIVLAILFSPIVIAMLGANTQAGAETDVVLSALKWLWVIVPVILILAIIEAKLTHMFYFYEVTDSGFRKEHGIIWKKYVTIPYGRIQNIDINRGLLARLLGLSDIQIQTAGSSSGRVEGRLPGLSREDAEKLRDELLRRANNSSNNSGL